jgi:mRNA interferase RelE/StbE
MYNILLEKRVMQYINSCPVKHQAQLKSKIFSLKTNPYPINYKALKGFAPYLRVDSGEYRVICRTGDKTILVILAGKRNDDNVYSAFKRLHK